VKKSEQLMWVKLRAELMDSGNVFQRHEDKLSKGIPDLSIEWQGIGTVWVELKVVTNGKVIIRPEQINWLSERRNALFLIKDGDAWHGVKCLKTMRWHWHTVTTIEDVKIIINKNNRSHLSGFATGLEAIEWGLRA
jgi:hypothetical protein